MAGRYRHISTILRVIITFVRLRHLRSNTHEVNHLNFKQDNELSNVISRLKSQSRPAIIKIDNTSMLYFLRFVSYREHSAISLLGYYLDWYVCGLRRARVLISSLFENIFKCSDSWFERRHSWSNPINYTQMIAWCRLASVNIIKYLFIVPENSVFLEWDGVQCCAMHTAFCSFIRTSTAY